MAVDADDCLSDVRYVLEQVADGLLHHPWSGVADRVGYVYGGGAGFDDCLHDIAQVCQIGAHGVLGRELDIWSQAFGVCHRFDGHLQHLLGGFAQLFLQMQP